MSGGVGVLFSSDLAEVAAPKNWQFTTEDIVPTPPVSRQSRHNRLGEAVAVTLVPLGGAEAAKGAPTSLSRPVSFTVIACYFWPGLSQGKMGCVIGSFVAFVSSLPSPDTVIIGGDFNLDPARDASMWSLLSQGLSRIGFVWTPRRGGTCRSPHAASASAGYQIDHTWIRSARRASGNTADVGLQHLALGVVCLFCSFTPPLLYSLVLRLET